MFDNGVWRRRYNYELYKLLKYVDIIKSIELNKIRSEGHIVRMGSSKTIFEFLLPLSIRKVPEADQKING